MKILRIATLAALFVVPLASQALTFNFNVVAAGGAPDGPAPWATLTVTDNGSNTVDFSLTNNSPATSKQFITELDLNITPFPASFTSFTVTSDPDHLLTGMTLSEDGIIGIDGDLFDQEVDFKKSANGARFTSGKTVSWELVATGLTAAAFDSLTTVGSNPMKAMLHIQGLADGTSSKVTTESVPEPTTLALLGIGVVGLARRRRS